MDVRAALTPKRAEIKLRLGQLSAYSAPRRRSHACGSRSRRLRAFNRLGTARLVSLAGGRIMNTRWTMFCVGALAAASPLSAASSGTPSPSVSDDMFSSQDGWRFVYANTGNGDSSSGDKAALIRAAREGRPIGARWSSWHGDVSGLCADTVVHLDTSIECHMEIWCSGTFDDAPDPHAHVVVLSSRGELHSLILGTRGEEERLWAIGQGDSSVRWFIQSPEPVADGSRALSRDASLHLASTDTLSAAGHVAGR